MPLRLSRILTILISFALFSNTLLAQEPTCGSVLPPDFQAVKHSHPTQFKQLKKDIEQRMENLSMTGSCINYAPIKAHIIRRTDGTGGLTVAQLDAAIAAMNIRYEAACMAFYICGAINYIDNDNYYDFDTSDEGALTSANNVSDLINIYFANSISSGTSSYCGYAYFPGGSDVILMKNSCTTNGSTLSHEMGHFFGLPHTHNSADDELVNGSNCATAGDDFCDTPADPQLGNSTVSALCVYTGTQTDNNGDLYMPDPTNIMSYSRKSCRDFFSVEQLTTAAFNFQFVRNYWDCPDFDVDFTVSATQSCNLPFTVNFTENAVGESTYEWDFNNDGTIDATTANPSYAYTTAGIFDVRLAVSDGTTTIQKVKTAHIDAGSRIFPYDQNMELFTVAYNATGYDDGWTTSPENTQSAYRWNTEAGPTTSSDTGPDVDHAPGNANGIYVYSEASGYNTGDIAELISPCLDISLVSVVPYIGFWYHMYGSNMGTLHIDLHDGTNWINDFSPAIVGQQQTSGGAAWLERTFDVSAYAGQSIQIRFRAERGNGFRSDMAIDDFSVFDNLALPVELLSFKGEKTSQDNHLLSWQTSSEEKSAYFLVEHSIDGRSFETLDKVAANGNTSIVSDYQFLHTYPSRPDNYYRLKMVDLDESFAYSNVVYLGSTKAQTGISIFPNPGKGAYQLSRSNDTEMLTIKIYNAVGQLIRTAEWLAGSHSHTLDIQDLPNAVYYLQFWNGKNIVGKELLVKL